jgi:hypothetical protein
MGFIVAVVLSAGSPAVFALRWALRASPEPPPASVPAEPPPVVATAPQKPPPRAPPTKLSLASLATTPLTTSQTLDAPDYKGSFDSFDAIANYEWAKRIGTAWKADALMQRISVSRVGKDGLVNLEATMDASVGYELFSPKCIKDYKESTAVVDAKMQCQLAVWIEKKGDGVVVQAMTRDYDLHMIKDTHELKSPVCTLTRAFQVLDKAGRVPEQPVFNAMLFTKFGRNAQPVWNIGQIAHGAPGVGWVNPRTCAIEP